MFREATARVRAAPGFVNWQYTMYHECMTRRYQLKQRAEQQEATRDRIVEAAVRLHGSIGPARTTVARIAELAGVGRQTLYRHFPDEQALFWACGGAYLGQHPLPDPEPWRSVAGLRERFRTGLQASYRYHRRTAPMMARVLADVRDHPIVAEYHAHFRRAADVIAAAGVGRGPRAVELRAAIRHAIRFETWHSLVHDEGLSDAQAIALMLRLVPGAPRRSRGRGAE
jgi:AcrR family transcriptional regulator